MKKIVFILLFLPVLLSAQSTTENLIGTWQGTDQGRQVSFAFDHEGYVVAGVGNLQMGGKDYEQQGKHYSFSYLLNEDVSPIALDMILTDKESGVQQVTQMIVDFIDANTLRMFSAGPNQPRATEFKEGTLVFTRATE